jgi:hypothetical protein
MEREIMEQRRQKAVNYIQTLNILTKTENYAEFERIVKAGDEQALVQLLKANGVPDSQLHMFKSIFFWCPWSWW